MKQIRKLSEGRKVGLKLMKKLIEEDSGKNYPRIRAL